MNEKMLICKQDDKRRKEIIITSDLFFLSVKVEIIPKSSFCFLLWLFLWLFFLIIISIVILFVWIFLILVLFILVIILIKIIIFQIFWLRIHLFYSFTIISVKYLQLRKASYKKKLHFPYQLSVIGNLSDGIVTEIYLFQVL